MNTYQEFITQFDTMFLKNKDRKEEMDKKHIISLKLINAKIDNEDVRWTDNIYSYVAQSKIFKLEEDIVEIFLNTDSDLEYIHLPFDTLFLDCKIPITNNLDILGLFLMDSPLDESISVLCYAEERRNENTMRHFINFGLKYWNRKAPNEVIDKEIYCDMDKPFFRRKLGLFIISFLKFLNNPEVEIINKEYTAIRIRRRSEEGKPVNNYSYLKITGKTKRYVSSFNEQINNLRIRHTFSWIVRGYYMKFKSIRYKTKQGTETWVAPYVKGIGQLKEKIYIVTEKKKVFYHQVLMEDYIKNLFRNHLILRNTRGFLDGLEIDVYIPDLKIGFEYNGKQHYNFIPAFHKSEKDLDRQIKRDQEKNRLAIQKGIRLITIRYDEELSEELIKSKLKEQQITNQILISTREQQNEGCSLS